MVLCARTHGFALVPSGGRTGLSGGAVAANGEVVVSMDKLKAVGAVNVTDRSVTVGAGAITQSIQDAASQVGLFISPLTSPPVGPVRLAEILLPMRAESTFSAME